VTSDTASIQGQGVKGHGHSVT